MAINRTIVDQALAAISGTKAAPKPELVTAGERALAEPVVRRFTEVFEAEVLEVVDLRATPHPEPTESSGTEFPASRCRACHSWIYWVSVHGAVVCATCHPPANLSLVAHWYSVPEGKQAARIQ
jgi:hypothetical protein